MHKSIYIIGLGILLISCNSQKSVSKTNTTPVKENPKPVEKVVKSNLKEENGLDFYYVNIADANKNNNTISYGSIVSAKPSNYKVVKTYFPSIGQNFRQKYLILHYTALNDEKSVEVLTQQSVSVHYLVNDLPDKEIYQLVDENKRAYHAGISAWRKDKMLNDTSIGIEIVNNGYTKDSLGNKVFLPYPDYQIAKVAALAKDIITRYMIPPTNVLGHSDIAPTRKQDPGPLFPWKKLYEQYGIGMWYEYTTKQFFLDQTQTGDFYAKLNDTGFILGFQSDLQKLGYEIALTGVWDNDTKKIIEAFQYHFRPEYCNGVLDSETWAILQALLQKYPN